MAGIPVAIMAVSSSSPDDVGQYKGVWVNETHYDYGDEVSSVGDLYQAIEAHTSSADTQPGVGISWSTKWARKVDMPTPTGTGVVHVTSGVIDTESKLIENADIDANADIEESKLAFSTSGHTHDGVNAKAISGLQSGGRLFVAPAYYQVADDAAYQLNSANTWMGFRFTAPVDFLIQAISDYMTAIGTPGENTYEVCEDGTAIEPNGDLNGSTTNVAPTMTANNAPSPYVLSYAPANAASYGIGVSGPDSTLWRIMDNSAGAFGFASKYHPDAAAVVDKGGGKVGIPITGVGAVTADTRIQINLVNYNGNYAADATSSANELVITAAYVAEVCTGGESVSVDPCASHPVYIQIDLGENWEYAINKFTITQESATQNTVAAMTLWGATSTPTDIRNDAEYTSLSGGNGPWTGLTSVGFAGGIRTFTVNNSKVYRYLRFVFTDTTNTNVSGLYIREIALYPAQSVSAPGTSLGSLGSLASGEVADTWKRLAIATEDQYQIQRDQTYWLVRKGAAGVDTSASVRRVHTGNGCSFPDGCISKYTADGGTTWTQTMQDSVPALWNVIINSQADHCPQVGYGRVEGDQVWLPGVGFIEIPQEGIFVDCSALTAGTIYNLYAYSNAGVLTLQASTTARTTSSGVEVETGATTYRYLGQIVPIEVQTGKQGPVDVEDMALLDYPGRGRRIGKSRPPFVISTYESIISVGYQKPLGGDAFKVTFLLSAPKYVSEFFTVLPISNSGQVLIYGGMSLDGATPEKQDVVHMSPSTTVYESTNIHFARRLLPPGIHTLNPRVQGNSPNVRLYYCHVGNATTASIVTGEIEAP